MKKLTLLAIGALTLCAGYLLDINAVPRRKRTLVNNTKTLRTRPAAYSTRKFNIAQTQLLQDLGPISRHKTISVPIPANGLKNAALVQFKPTDDATLQTNQVDQILVRTQPLSQKKAAKHNLDWISGKGQVLVEIFAGQSGPAADHSKLTRQFQHALLKSELADKGPLKLKVNKTGEVGIKMKGTDGKYAPLANFHIAQSNKVQKTLQIQ